jgi:hypothetical protein
VTEIASRVGCGCGGGEHAGIEPEGIAHEGRRCLTWSSSLSNEQRLRRRCARVLSHGAPGDFLHPFPSAEEIPACIQAGCSATGPGAVGCSLSAQPDGRG